MKDPNPIVYIPENTHSNNTGSEQTTSFDIDGYWYSSDYRYVYRIYTKQSDGGFNTFCFANIKSGGGIYSLWYCSENIVLWNNIKTKRKK